MKQNKSMVSSEEVQLLDVTDLINDIKRRIWVAHDTGMSGTFKYYLGNVLINLKEARREYEK